MDVDLERDLEVDLESLLSETVKSLASPVKLACALFTERFFDEAELRRFGSDVSVCEQREILLTCLKKKLNRSNEPDGNCGNTSGKYIIKVIASLLIHHNDVLLGKKLLHSCGKIFVSFLCLLCNLCIDTMHVYCILHKIYFTHSSCISFLFISLVTGDRLNLDQEKCNVTYDRYTECTCRTRSLN